MPIEETLNSLRTPEVNQSDSTASSQRSVSPTLQLPSKKKKRIDEVDERIQKPLEQDENPHLSFCKSFLPMIHDFDEEEIIDFQMGVLQLIRNIKKKRREPTMPLSFSNVKIISTESSEDYHNQPINNQIHTQSNTNQQSLYQYPHFETITEFQQYSQGDLQHIGSISPTTQKSASSPSSLTSQTEDTKIHIDLTEITS